MDKSKLKRALVVLILIVLFSFRLWQTTGCQKFKSFYLNPQAVTIKVEEDVGTDKQSLRSSSLDELETAGLRGVDRNISRFFHNKYQSRFVLTVQSMTSMLDARLLTDVLGPLGVLAFAVSVYTTIKTKKILGILHFFIVFLAVLFATFTPHAKQGFYLWAVALYSFSFWSTKTIVKLPTWLILLLVVTTFWYFSFSWQLESFCHDIFFN